VVTLQPSAAGGAHAWRHPMRMREYVSSASSAPDTHVVPEDRHRRWHDTWHISCASRRRAGCSGAGAAASRAGHCAAQAGDPHGHAVHQINRKTAEATRKPASPTFQIKCCFHKRIATARAAAQNWKSSIDHHLASATTPLRDGRRVHPLPGFQRSRVCRISLSRARHCRPGLHGALFAAPACHQPA